MSRPENYYRLLGVAADASQDEIRKAFRERVRACHPDRVASLDEDLRSLAEEKMVTLNEAYAVLRNPSRRTAYDERRRGSSAPPGDTDHGTSNASTRAAAPAPTDGRPGGTTGDGATGTRSRIGEQHFVTRAAAEEFEQTVKRTVSGRVGWAPAAVPGATLALHGRRGRSNLYFALLAESHLDPLQTQHFFHALRSFCKTLSDSVFVRSRLFGFAAAVTFGEQPRQRRALERFNRAHAGAGPLQQATFIDLANWHVIPGETGLPERLDALLRGA